MNTIDKQHFCKTRDEKGTIYAVVDAYTTLGVSDEIIPYLIKDLTTELVSNVRELELTDTEDLLSYFKGFVEGWKDLDAVKSEWNV